MPADISECWMVTRSAELFMDSCLGYLSNQIARIHIVYTLHVVALVYRWWGGRHEGHAGLAMYMHNALGNTFVTIYRLYMPECLACMYTDKIVQVHAN